jgi:hypothetical protein
LHGAGSGLNIYDGSEGINFISKENNILFSITPTGLGEKDSEFIKISDNEVNFIGNHLRTKDNKNFL